MIFSSSFFAELESNYPTVWISDQAQHFDGLDQDPNCLHRLSPGLINSLLACKELTSRINSPFYNLALKGIHYNKLIVVNQ